MAITLQPLKLSINLTSVVDGAISSVKAVRKTEQARKEAEFQRAIANGLSYDEQVRLRKEQLEEEEYLSALTSQLNGIDYPELRVEIQGDITAAQAKVKTYKDTILANQVKKAKYDGTRATLTDAISRVNTARAEALINDNEDEVTTYDETLSALNSQLSGVKIQDSITD